MRTHETKRAKSATDDVVAPQTQSQDASWATGLSSDQIVKDGGQPLPADLATGYGERLGADLSNVRVHTGGDAARAADGANARAFTTGQDIHFGAGEFNPGTKEGQKLIAHEVAHTVQGGTSAAAPAMKSRVSDAGEAHEREADHVADALVDGGGPVRVTESASPAVVHRKAKDTNEADDAFSGDDQGELARLAIRAAHDAAQDAIKIALKAKTEGAAKEALSGAAPTVKYYVKRATYLIGKSSKGEEIKNEAKAFMPILDQFMGESKMFGLSIDAFEDIYDDLKGWAGAVGKAHGTGAKGFSKGDAGHTIGLSLRGVRHLSEMAIHKFKPGVDTWRHGAITLAQEYHQQIISHLQQVKVLFSTEFVDEKSREPFKEEIETASHGFGELIAWMIYMRADKETAIGEALMNEVRRAAGLAEGPGWLGARPKEDEKPAKEFGKEITTGNFEDAKDKVWLEYQALLRTQSKGISELESAIPKSDRQDPTFFAKVVIFFADVALQAATGFIGGAVAHKLAEAGASAVSRGINTMVNDAVKGGLRIGVKQALSSKFTSTGEAAKAFCLGQMEVLDQQAYDQESTFLNNVDGVRDIEKRQKGAGIAELEMMRHNIAEVRETQAKQVQKESSLVEWCKALAQGSAGSVDKNDPTKGSKTENVADPNTQHAGVLQMGVAIDYANPQGPLKIENAVMPGVNKELGGVLDNVDKTIGELKMPVSLSSHLNFDIGMNENKDVWLTVISGALTFMKRNTMPTYTYLYERAHGVGSTAGKSRDEVKDGAVDGAIKIMHEDVAKKTLKQLNVAGSGVF